MTDKHAETAREIANRYCVENGGTWRATRDIQMALAAAEREGYRAALSKLDPASGRGQPLGAAREVERICNGAEFDARYAARIMNGHPMQHNVKVLAETFKLIRRMLVDPDQNDIPAPPAQEPESAPSGPVKANGEVS